MAVIMGCDASLTCTGLAAMQTEHISALGVPDLTELYTRAITPTKLNGIERLRYIRNEFARDLLRLEPTLVVFEGYARATMAMREEMGEVQGILRLRCHDEGIPFIVATPQGLKKYATSKGAGDKSIVRACVERRWGLVSDAITHDEVDAFVLMMIGAGYLGHTDLTAYQEAVIKSVNANPHGIPGGKTQGSDAPKRKGRPMAAAI